MKENMCAAAAVLAAAAACAAGGCGDLPRDADGWTARIRRTGVMPVGIPSASPEDAAHADLRERERRIVEAVARQLNARVEWRSGNPIQLIGELERRHLPLVAAEIPASTPYNGLIAVSRPYRKHGPNREDYSLAVAPGENRLLLLVDRAAEAEVHAPGGNG